MRIRVLQFAWRLSHGGGIPATIRDALAHIDRDSFDLHLCTVRPFSEEDRDGGVPGVELHTLGINGPVSPAVRLSILAGFRRVAREVNPHVLHTHSGIGWYSLPWRLGAGRGAGAILEVHDTPDRPGTSTTYRIMEGLLLRRFGYRALVHSSSVRDSLVRAHRIDARAIDVVAIGIDTVRFAQPATPSERWRSEVGIAEDALVVLYVTRLVPSKNIPLFIDVAEEVVRTLPAVRFVLVGGGSQRGEVERAVRTRGLDDAIHVLGFREDLVDAYHAADVFLSTSEYEGFGIAALEAMATGLPVVATAAGGVAEVIEDGRTGRLAGPGDGPALATALLDLLGDEGRRRRYGAAGARRAHEHFDASLMARRYEALYRSAASLEHRPSRQRATATEEASPPARRRVFLLKYFDSSEPRDMVGPWRLPYALDSLSDAGVELRWSDADHRPPWTGPRVRRIVRRLEQLSAPFLSTLLGTREIARADAVLAVFESQGNLLAALRAMHVPPYTRPRLVVVACWLAMEAQHAGWARRVLYRFAYRGVDRLVYFSKNQAEIYRTVLGIPDERLVFVPFGVDHHLFSPVDAPEDGSVLAVGRDRGRDWATLFEAVRGTDLRVRVASRPGDIVGLDVPPNVEPVGFVDAARYRELTGRASVVAVPTEVRAYPTGQSVTLEAMAMGKCCVVTDTPAMRDYLSNDNALLVAPHDALALRASLERAVADSDLRRKIGHAARRAVVDRFTAEGMWRSVADLL